MPAYPPLNNGEFMPLRTRNACLAAIALVAANVSSAAIAQIVSENTFCLKGRYSSVMPRKCISSNVCVPGLFCVYPEVPPFLFKDTKIICRKDGDWNDVESVEYTKHCKPTQNNNHDLNNSKQYPAGNNDNYAYNSKTKPKTSPSPSPPPTPGA